MMGAGWGRIVNIWSSSTHSGQPFMAHYVVVKSAVNGLTKSLALEYGPSGVTVNALPPRFIDTPMLRSAERGQLLGRTVADHIERTSVRRMGRPEDVAAAWPSLCPRKPVTSPDRYSASTAAATPDSANRQGTNLALGFTDIAIWGAGYSWPKKGPATPDLTTAQGRSSAERGVSTSPVTQPLPT
jgi:NAD(P)-dependent dehydrogenase (short-subunit alcohol dehydrogenase family)